MAAVAAALLVLLLATAVTVIASAFDGVAPMAAGSRLALGACSDGAGGWRLGPASSLQWSAATQRPAMPGLCLSTGPHPRSSSYPTLEHCQQGAAQTWRIAAGTPQQLRSGNLCATAKGASAGHAAVGSPIDLWACVNKTNQYFQFNEATGTICTPQLSPRLCVVPDTRASPGPPPVLSGPLPVDIASARAGRRWDGLGGLSAGASSRLLLDYREPQRSQILDLLFKKKTGGT
eukprot:SAG31_NODE_12098_length_968_cov_2.277330_1_plen_232_part_01